ncbi:unnamed protein product, partial [marine sediment metagenome]
PYFQGALIRNDKQLTLSWEQYQFLENNTRVMSLHWYKLSYVVA